MKRFKLSTEVLFSEDAIDALLEEKDENAVLITDKFMVDSGMADMILKKLSNCKEVSVFSEVVPDPPMDLMPADKMSDGDYWLTENDFKIYANGLYQMLLLPFDRMFYLYNFQY